MTNIISHRTHTSRSSLGQSGEDYLEAVLVLGRRLRAVRVRDLAQELCVSRPSVVAAVASLEARGLVAHEHYGYVELTAAGRNRAEAVYRRHTRLFDFLHGFLGLPATIAEADACRMEHVISPATLEALLRLSREGRLAAVKGHDRTMRTGPSVGPKPDAGRRQSRGRRAKTGPRPGRSPKRPPPDGPADPGTDGEAE